MRPDDGHVAGLGIGVIERNVLLHGELDRRVGGYGGTRVFADVLSIKDVLLDCEARLGHGCDALGVDRMTCSWGKRLVEVWMNKAGIREERWYL